MARRTYSRAGSTPPMSSTIRSEPERISSNEPLLRVSTPASSGRSPVIRSIRPAWAWSWTAKAAPTVPWPSSPTRKRGPSGGIAGCQVCVGLAAHDHPGLAARAEHDRWARHAVVVVGHRVSVGAGGRHDDHVARPGVRQDDVLDDHVTRLAVLAGQPAALALPGQWAVGE